ncbi:MAG: PKD domain-containing protein [Pseudomonadota bacterium]
MKLAGLSPYPTLRAKPLALAVLLGLSASPAAIAQQYFVTDLGPDVSPADINIDGTIVGSYKKPGETLSTAFRYPASGGLNEIEDIGGPGTAATAINDLEQIVGNTPDGAFLLDGDSRREWRDFGAYGINEDGWISGNAVMDNPYRDVPKPLAPAVYTGNKWEVMDIANVYSRGTRQGVYADLYYLFDINTRGAAAGRKSRYGLAGSSAILIEPPYSGVQSAADVSFLPPGGSATGINDLDTIVGTSSESRAYLCWNACADPLDLVDVGTLLNEDGEFGLRSSAADVNESNQVVGNSWLEAVNTSIYDPSRYHAFVWDEARGIRDLNAAELTEVPAGWILTQATAINEQGDIVGTGLLNGEAHGFLLTTDPLPPPPPPEDLSPVAVASADPVRGKVPLTVNFSAAGSYDPEGTALTYSWNFGNSDVSSLENPEYTYTEVGSYTATLVVEDEGGNPSEASQVVISVRKSNRK